MLTVMCNGRHVWFRYAVTALTSVESLRSPFEETDRIDRDTATERGPKCPFRMWSLICDRLCAYICMHVWTWAIVRVVVSNSKNVQVSICYVEVCNINGERRLFYETCKHRELWPGSFIALYCFKHILHSRKCVKCNF